MSRLTASTAAEGVRAVYGVEQYCQATIDGPLYELIKLRASVLNGCSYCVDMHSRDALAHGEDTRKLFAVAAWREAPFFTDRERAALALTDSVTRLGPDGVPDDVWKPAAALFTEKELADLVLGIATINLWNRLNIATRNEPPVTV
ncbi:MAG TPA: carboxymuconolactone decarboxylase family protein [Actinocatenispora sp.]